MLTKNDLIRDFRQLGLTAGDTVLVHSAFKSLGGVEGGLQTLLEAFQEVLTPDGTLIAPLFNFDFCQGTPWDIRSTPSHMGAFTELVRQHPQATRIFHPIYSFGILGKLAPELGQIRNKSSYGADSLFAKLRELDGKIMVIGLEYNHSMTFFHHIEEMEGVDYRYMKSFTGEVTDWDGKPYTDTFTMLVRDWDRGVQTQVNPMGALLEELGIIQTKQIGAAKVSLMKAAEVYAASAREMRRDPFLLYQISSPEEAKSS